MAEYDYKKYRQIKGKVCIENKDHETIAKLVADGESDNKIIHYMEITADDLEAIKSPDIYILSTPKGVMSGKQAMKARVGGEVIAKVI